MEPSPSSTGKAKAFWIHLAVSTCVAGALLWVLVSRWYPLPYFVSDGGWQGIRVVVAIDVVLGPLITLIVYHRRKSRKALLFDYTVIGCLQIAALSFGIWTVFSQRTVLVVYTDGTFYTVDAETASGLGPRVEHMLEEADGVPAYAYVDMSDNAERRQNLRREALKSGIPLYKRAELLRPFSCRDVAEKTQDAGLNVEKRLDSFSQEEFFVEARDFLTSHDGTADDYLFFPATGRYRDFTLVFRRRDCSLAGWLPAYPEGGKERSEKLKA